MCGRVLDAQLILLFLFLLFPPMISFGATPYDIGTPVLTDIWIDPVNGSDSNDGASRFRALRTLPAAWGLVPEQLTVTGYRINLLPGSYSCEPGPEESNCINFFSDKTGTAAFPVLIQAQNGPDSVFIRGGLNIERVRHLYLVDLNLVGGTPLPTNSSGNNLLHLSNSSHVLLRRLDLRGPACDNDTCNNLQEVLKVNQVQHLYVEDSTIGGAWHSSVDYMVVQYGNFLNNRVHTAGQWCMYVKGGASYLNIEGNEMHGCLLGFEAGEGSNLAMMVSPWLHYESYDVKFVNNYLHDIPGEGFNAHGCYNCLFAYNTFYNVGTSTANGYPLLRADQGERNCTPVDGLEDPLPTCQEKIASGGWGPNFLTSGSAVVPNRNILIYNNLFYNPAGSSTMYSHMAVAGSVTQPAGFMNIPDPATSDHNLIIRGNLIWNGSPEHPLGIEDPPAGCQDSNLTCTAAQLRAENTINIVDPGFIDQAHGDFHPSPGSTLYGVTTYAIPDFSWSDAPRLPWVPTGSLSNVITVDRDGLAVAAGPPGAFRTSAGFRVRRVFGDSYEYTASMSEAYRRVNGNGERIQLKAGSYDGFLLNKPWSWYLEGGYGNGFAGERTFSIISGGLKLSGGRVSVKNITVRPPG